MDYEKIDNDARVSRALLTEEIQLIHSHSDSKLVQHDSNHIMIVYETIMHSNDYAFMLRMLEQQNVAFCNLLSI